MDLMEAFRRNGREVEADPIAPAAPQEFLDELASEIDAAGGPVADDGQTAGAIGATMFDSPGSEDGTITVLLPQASCQAASSQSLLRIVSRGDGRRYLGIVTAGPFAEPDTLRADSQVVTSVIVRGGQFYMPPYHGRVQVALLGEELADGTLVPPRLRPLPNSPVFALDAEESAGVLRTDGDLRLGVVVGHEDVEVRLPSDNKSVLPRHMAILGTTGGGKSTSVAALIAEARAANLAIIVLDVEGEYVRLNEPTDDPKMLAALASRGLEPRGLPTDDMTVYHLAGRDPAYEGHPNLQPFSLQFARLSPYTAAEIFHLSEAQEERFFRAYDIAKLLLRDLKIFPNPDAPDGERQLRMAAELDEFDRGYPRLTLDFLRDVVMICHDHIERRTAANQTTRSRSRGADTNEAAPEPSTRQPFSPELQTDEARRAIGHRIHQTQLPASAISWRGLMGRLGRLARMKVFDRSSQRAGPIQYKNLLRPGKVSIFDLSDSGASELNNLVIADILRGLQEAQDKIYRDHEKGNGPQPTGALIIIEESHEFLGADRIDRMPHLFEQVARVAKRGRKRRLGLVFVTQLPQHLPRQVLGLVNSFILHKITDPQVTAGLRRTIPGIDESLWSRLAGLAQGQAIVSLPHMTRPLLVSMHGAPGKLRLVD
jgi:DNA helicase HerA-like ATPase